MSLYRLPDRLGGETVEGTEYHRDGDLWVWFSCGDWMYHVRAQALTKVEPPLPPEPNVPAVIIGGRVWVRHGFDGDYNWNASGFHAHSWLALNQLSQGVPIVPLVPYPVASAPELPFVASDRDGDPLQVNVSEGRTVYLLTSAHGVDLSPEEAETAAHAILRAARDAREATGGKS